MQTTSLNQGQSQLVSAQAVAGTVPGEINSVPTWGPALGTNFSAAGITVTPATDGLSATVAALPSAVPGTYGVNVVAGIRTGASVNTTFAVVITEPAATGFNFTFGIPTP